jgi:uncharacterized membrane protein YebE (DUF533 family)
MAKVVKARKGGRKTRVVTKIQRVKVQAKRAASRARRAVSVNVSKRDIVVTCAAGGAGAIGSALLVSKMPETVPDTGKNAIVVAIGAFAAYRGFKKRNKVLIGAGIGAASVGCAGLVSSVKAATTTTTVSAPLAIPYSQAARLAAPVDVTEFAAPFAGAEMDQI